MKLYIKQKVFTWGDKFTVKDEFGEDRYTVAGEVFTIGRKLHVNDMAGHEVIYIDQEVWAWLGKYHVHIQGQHAADVQRKFSWLHPKYEISGPACSGWTVEGNFTGHDYEVLDGAGSCIVRITKEWMTWGDSYVLEIADPADELLALALVLTIDCVKASQDN